MGQVLDDDDDDEFQTAPSTRHQSMAVDKTNSTKDLPGVFVPTCLNETVALPPTIRKSLGPQRRPSIIQPKHPTTVNCSLLANKDTDHLSRLSLTSPISPSTIDTMVGQDKPTEIKSSGANDSLPAEVEVHATSRTSADNQASLATRIRDQQDEPSSRPSASKPEGTQLSAEEGTKPTRAGYRVFGKSHIMIQDVMRKVRDRLSGHRQEEHAPSDDNEEFSLCHRNSCQYILDDSQVQDVVELVLVEMCKHNGNFVELERASKKYEGNANTDRKVVRKPSCLANSIEPQPPNTADPTTTITKPRTPFFARGTDVSPPQASLANILSRDGIVDTQQPATAEPPVVDLSAENQPVPPSRIQSECSPTHFDTSTFNDGRTSSPGSLTSESPDGFRHDGITEQQEHSAHVHRGTTDQEPITSFPALTRRHCSKEWISPPASLEQETDDMCNNGVNSRPDEGQFRCPFDSPSEVHKDESDRTTPSKEPRTRSISETGTDASHVKPNDFGHTLGRRNSDKPLLRSWSTNLSGRFVAPEAAKPKDGFLQKVTRKLSSVFQNPTRSPAIRAPAPSEASGPVSRRVSEALIASRGDLEEERPGAGYLSEPEPSAVYQAMRLSKPVKAGAPHRSTYSEDNVPRECDAPICSDGLESPRDR